MNPKQLSVGESGEHGTYTFQRVKATARTVGGGTNTLCIEADDAVSFPSAQRLVTINLNALSEFNDTTLDNAWTLNQNHFLRCRCPTLSSTAPQDVVVQFFWKEQTW